MVKWDYNAQSKSIRTHLKKITHPTPFIQSNLIVSRSRAWLDDVVSGLQIKDVDSPGGKVIITVSHFLFGLVT